MGRVEILKRNDESNPLTRFFKAAGVSSRKTCRFAEGICFPIPVGDKRLATKVS